MKILAYCFLGTSLFLSSCSDNYNNTYVVALCPNPNICLSKETIKRVENEISDIIEFSKTNTKYQVLNYISQSAKGENYMFALGLDGASIKNPHIPQIEGEIILDIQDEITGRYIVKEIIDIAKATDDYNSKWYSYYFKNPLTGEIQQKIILIQMLNHDESSYVVASGAYVK